MLGAGGCIPGRRDFLVAVRELTTAGRRRADLRRGDDVAPCRSAAPRSCSAITPDLTTLGKYLAGGLSFGAFGGRRDVMAAFEPAAGGGLTHGGTFNNNAFTMAVGAAVAGAGRRRLAGDAQRARRAAAPGLERAVRAPSPLAFTATGWGSLLSIHPVRGPIERPADLAGADPRWRQLLFHELLAHGYLHRPHAATSR